MNAISANSGPLYAPFKTEPSAKKDYYTAKEGVPGFTKDIPLYELPSLKPGETGLKWYGPKKFKYPHMNFKDETYVGTQHTHALDSTKAKVAVIDFYKNKMVKQGWECWHESVDERNIYYLGFRKDNRYCDVDITSVKDSDAWVTPISQQSLSKEGCRIVVAHYKKPNLSDEP